MNPYDLTHIEPPLCFDVPSNGTYGTLVRCSYDINDVTCPKCVYYYFKPGARKLEIEYMKRCPKGVLKRTLNCRRTIFPAGSDKMGPF